MKENKSLRAVNVVSDKYLEVNNCSPQTRKDGFTVTRSEGWRDYQLLLITDGECVAYHNGAEYRLSAGGVILYAPSEPQKYIFPHECKSLWVHFSGTAVEEILSSCELSSGIYPLAPDQQLTALFFSLIQRFHHEQTRKYACASMIELLCCVSDLVRRADGPFCPSGISAVLDHITRNYDQDFTLPELARLSGYSRSRFSYLFKRYINKTPVEYQRSIRLHSACDLLCATLLPVSEIAAACGYADALYFSRIFKSKFGISPTEYRKNNI